MSDIPTGQIFETFITVRVMGRAEDARAHESRIPSLSRMVVDGAGGGEEMLASAQIVATEAITAPQALHRIEELGGDAAAFDGGAFLDAALGDTLGEPGADLESLIEARRAQSGYDADEFAARLVGFVIAAGAGHALAAWLEHGPAGEGDPAMIVG